MSADVLIVGAGPTGLMLACWLARLGIRPLVIDKKEGLTRESRALAVQARTLETYDTLGIVERALPQGVRVAAVNILLKQHRVGRIKLGEIGRGLSPYPYLFVMGQDKTEHLLLEHYLEQGGQVRWESSPSGSAGRASLAFSPCPARTAIGSWGSFRRTSWSALISPSKTSVPKSNDTATCA